MDFTVKNYNVSVEDDKRIAIAKSKIVKIFYKEETTFSFEKFSTRLKRAFDILSQYGQAKSGKEEVKITLNQINSNKL